MNDELLVFNGVNGVTGSYLQEPISPDQLSKIVLGSGEAEEPDAHTKELQYRAQSANEAHFGVKYGVDPEDLAQSGWGVIFAHDSDPKIKEALDPLLRFREAQANASKSLFKELVYRPKETKEAFLRRYGMGPGQANPDKVPYYLMIVGDPEAISYRFQYELDVIYAVGRIHFDSIEGYRNYARSVVEFEQASRQPQRHAAFFGVRNGGDRATQMSADLLVSPLSEILKTQKSNWEIQTCLADDATKGRLLTLLGGDQTPSLLFTASHGMGFPADDPRQRTHQGALLCQDWPGVLRHQGPIPESFYFSADDLAADAQLSGLICVHFACYGAGTPRLDDFAHGQAERATIAPQAFVAQLPQRLLAHPGGGALAIIGHVERAWGYSFSWPGAKEQTDTFESLLSAVMDGVRIGSAMESFNQRYADLTATLTPELEDIRFGKQPDELELTKLWTANNDARSYVVIGDPAVRLNPKSS